jgi:hypothetical protein
VCKKCYELKRALGMHHTLTTLLSLIGARWCIPHIWATSGGGGGERGGGGGVVGGGRGVGGCI